MKKILSFTIILLLLFLNIAYAENIESETFELAVEVRSSTVTATKQLIGEIWQVRCDVMDDTETSFWAGGGMWKADFTNKTNNTSGEGHRSNHCGKWENGVLFVNSEGKATGLYQLKSGSTGGTLASVIYHTPEDLINVGEGELKYDN